MSIISKAKTLNNILITPIIILATYLIARGFMFSFTIDLTILATGLLILTMIEVYKPAFKSDKTNKTKRWIINFSLTLMVIYISSFAFAFISQKKGLLNIFEINFISEVVITILIFDFVFYIGHRYTHINSFLWRFHSVHHSDTALDISSALRAHIMDAIILFIFRVSAILIFGFAPIPTLIYIIVLSIYLPFIHSNIHLPDRINKIINLIFVTPNMHYIHHSNKINELKSNYGIIFSIWDRLLGTYKAIDINNYKNIKIGLKGYNKEELTFLKLLFVLPFKKRYG